MALLPNAAVSGVSVGLLYGLLAFSVVLLFKTTGIANFAQGNLATLSTFVVYRFLRDFHTSLPMALIVGVGASATIGVLVYVVVMRVNDSAGHLNLTARTLALYLLLFALMNMWWGAGQPFAFPQLVLGAPLRASVIIIPIDTIEALAAALVLGLVFAWFFRVTRLGLLMRGVADRADVSHLLGVDTRRLTAAAWVMATIVALVVGTVSAHQALLTSGMMDAYLLYAFTAAILGGLTSLFGAFAGGVATGLVSSIVSVYWGPDISVLAVFVLLLVVLLVKPAGIFGQPIRERL